MEVTVNLNTEQLAAIDALSAATGMDRDTVVQRAVYNMALLQKAGPHLYAELLPGLLDVAAGRYAQDEDVDAVFRKYGAR